MDCEPEKNCFSESSQYYILHSVIDVASNFNTFQSAVVLCYIRIVGIDAFEF